MAKNQKVKVSERALLARVNRQLQKESMQLRKCKKDSSGYDELGDYFQVDLSSGVLVANHVDLSSIANKLEVLADYEILDS